MVLDSGTIFTAAKEGADEFFISEAEEALRPRIVVKEADQDVDDTEVVVNDTELFMSLSANQTYEFEIYLNATEEFVKDPGLRYTFTGPTGSIGRFWETVWDHSQLTSFKPRAFVAEIARASASGIGWAAAKGWIKTGDTAGNLQFMWANEDDTENAYTRIQADSWLKVTRQ